MLSRCVRSAVVLCLLTVFGSEEQEKHAEERLRLLGPLAHPLAPNPLDSSLARPPLASEPLHNEATAVDDLKMSRG